MISCPLVLDVTSLVWDSCFLYSAFGDLENKLQILPASLGNSKCLRSELVSGLGRWFKVCQRNQGVGWQIRWI